MTIRLQINVVGAGDEGTISSQPGLWRDARRIMTKMHCTALEIADAKRDLADGSKVLVCAANPGPYVEFAPQTGA